MSNDASDEQPKSASESGPQPDRPEAELARPEAEPQRAEPSDDGETSGKKSFVERRREKVREEIERNRRGEHIVPTWVLVVALIVVVVGWVSLILFA